VRVCPTSLNDLDSEDKIDSLNIRDLKEILAANFVDFKGCVEKTELIDRVRRLYRDRQTAQLKGRSYSLHRQSNRHTSYMSDKHDDF
jgi:hypothetical protein